MSRKELAEALETNVRNVSEFKKELEISGYVIDTVAGAHGGYCLRKERILPSVTLDNSETKSINEAIKYLKKSNFAYYDEFLSAMDKYKLSIKNPQLDDKITYLFESEQISDKEKKMLNLILNAIDEEKIVEVTYMTLKDEKEEIRVLMPYEILKTKNGNYVNAYDITPKKSHDYKNFKISEQRMKDLKVTGNHFIRNKSYSLFEHIGKQGLFKNAANALLSLSGINAKLINEREIGINSKKRMNDGKLIVDVTFNSELELMEFILSLGSDVKVLKPESLVIKHKKILSEALDNY